VARDEAGADESNLPEIVVAIARDAETLLAQHASLLRSELRGELRAAAEAAAALGAGAGLVTVGGLFGAFMLVHAIHRTTRLPLSSCYGLVGGLMATLGAALMATGTRRASALHLVPRETIAALREDVAWVKDQIAPATS
jgi:hypothetical protein